MVSALPARVALSQLDGALDQEPPVGRGVLAAQPSGIPEAAAAQERTRPAATLQGCTAELLEALPIHGRRRVEVGGEARDVRVVDAAAFVRAAADLGEQLPALSIDDGTGAQQATWPARLEELWRLLTDGRSLVLEPAPAPPEPDAPVESDAHDPPDEPDEPEASDAPEVSALAPDRAEAIDRLPPLRTAPVDVVHRTASHLLVLDPAGLDAQGVVDAARRVLAELSDVRLCVPRAPAEAQAYLGALLGGDPRYLADVTRPVPGVPHVVLASAQVPLTTQMLATLARQLEEQDIGVARALVDEEGGGQLAMLRTAALHLVAGSDALAADVSETLDAVAETAGFAWVPAAQLGLEPDADEDVLGTSTAMSRRQLTRVGVLQRRLTEERNRRRATERQVATLEKQLRATKQELPPRPFRAVARRVLRALRRPASRPRRGSR